MKKLLAVIAAFFVSISMAFAAVNINSAMNLVNLPFGGFKESGIGREGGRWGMDEYTEVQQITWKA